MTETNPECFHLSASAISAFKACPQRFRLAYREGLRPAQDTEAQRMGTNWHALHEVYQNERSEALEMGNSPEKAEDRAMEAAVDHLNERYAQVPATVTPTEWALEREKLLVSFMGYLWYWQDDPIEVLHSELAFDLPVHHPKTGLPLPTSQAIRVGKIDHVALWQGMIGNVERKSTTRSIDAGSDYWDKAKKDTQVSMYALGFRDMAAAGLLPDAVTSHADYDPGRVGNTLYDVWHKPTIKPAKLTQKDTAAFIESGEYRGAEFTVKVEGEDPPVVTVDGEEVEVEQGKKGFAIRESVSMYGARLLDDIYERPEFYYARREIARTDKDLEHFRKEVYNIYQAQRTFANTGHWYENEQQCRATFPCAYIPICYGPGADAVCDGETTPDSFKRIFTDLTVGGEEVNQED